MSILLAKRRLKAAWLGIMGDFTLHPVLENDCYQMGCLGESLLLLLNNKLVPWFILVPKTKVKELYELDTAIGQDVAHSINRLSRFIKDEFQADTLNVAAIGNVVPQLHIHVIGRNKNDYCWPGVVWGVEGSESYEDGEVVRIRRELEAKLVIN